MLSEIEFNALTFDELTRRVCIYIRGKINNGEFTERALARIFHVSQPHLHNMLKGARKMNRDFADRALIKFGITILDLIHEEEIWSFLDHRNPDWLTRASLPKPPRKATQRETYSSSPWDKPQTGS